MRAGEEGAERSAGGGEVMQRQSAVDQFDDVQEKIPLAVYVFHMCCVLSLTADLLWEGRPSFESTGEIQEFCWERERILQEGENFTTKLPRTTLRTGLARTGTNTGKYKREKTQRIHIALGLQITF